MKDSALQKEISEFLYPFTEEIWRIKLNGDFVTISNNSGRNSWGSKSMAKRVISDNFKWKAQNIARRSGGAITEEKALQDLKETYEAMIADGTIEFVRVI